MTMTDTIFADMFRTSIFLYVGRLIQIQYKIAQYNNFHMMFSIKCDKNVKSCYWMKDYLIVILLYIYFTKIFPYHVI